jgi:hypothetical protein
MERFHSPKITTYIVLLKLAQNVPRRWTGHGNMFIVDGYYAGAVAGKIGAVLFAGCVAGVEGEGKDVETELRKKIETTN